MHENPVLCNGNDASGERGIWAQEEKYAKCTVRIQEDYYDIKFIKPVKANGSMYLEANAPVLKVVYGTKDTDVLAMNKVYFSELDCDLILFYAIHVKNPVPILLEMSRLY